LTPPDPLDALARVCALAEGQWGYVALAQLPAELPDAFLTEWESAGIVESVMGGVVRVRAGGRHPHPRLYAAWLLLDTAPAWERSLTAAVVSHRSAAQLCGVGTIMPTAFEFTGGAGPGVPDEVVIHPAAVREDECIVVEGLPVTGPGRTIADLADGQGLDLSDLGRVARSLIGQDWITADQLGAELTAQFAGRGVRRDGPKWLAAALEAAMAG
jgi:hypothetical protein